MKLIKSTMIKILALIAAMVWIGCDDLDFPDPNNPTDDTATIQSLVTGAESQLRSGLGIYLRDMLVVGREAYYLEPADPRYTGELLRGPIDPGGFLCYTPWAATYKVISNCQTIIGNSEADEGAIGFAQTLNAYALMRIVNFTEINDNNRDARNLADAARLNYDGNIEADVATRAEVLAEIETLLNSGLDNLNAAGDCDENTEGKQFCFSLSDGFAGFDTPETFAHFNRGLMARVSVLQDKWSQAQEALTSVDAWMNGIDHDAGVYHVFSSGANDVDNQMFEDPNAATLKLMVHPSFLTDAHEGDSRVSSNVLVRQDTIRYDGLESYLAPTLYISSYDPVPMMRAVELQLLQAEVHIGNGDYASAESIMNSIRAVAGAAEYTGTDASNAHDRVLHEKRYSLFLEGHRLTDMRHYGKTSELPLDRSGDAIVTFPIPETETPG